MLEAHLHGNGVLVVLQINNIYSKVYNKISNNY